MCLPLCRAMPLTNLLCLQTLLAHFKAHSNDGIPVLLSFCCRHYDRKVKMEMDAARIAAATAAAAAAPAPPPPQEESACLVCVV